VRTEIDHDGCYSKGKVPLQLPPGTGLLYPQAPSRDLATLTPAERPQHLLVIDGTWHHAKTLFRDVPGLDHLPRYHLQPPQPSQYRLRREPHRDFVSTIEAITYCLLALEPDTPGIDSLTDVFAKMIDRQVAARAEATGQGRSVKRARPYSARRLPRGLAERFEDLVVTYGEAASFEPGGPKALLHWTARRLATAKCSNSSFGLLDRSPPICSNTWASRQSSSNRAAAFPSSLRDGRVSRGVQTFLRPGIKQRSTFCPTCSMTHCPTCF
jgi:DTW domain-containing protein YfiP